MSWLAPNTTFQFDPQLFGEYREPQDSILSSGGLDDTFFNDAFDFTTPYNIAPSPVVQKKSLIAEIDAAKEEDTTPSLLTCNKIWYVLPRILVGSVTDNHHREKLQNCPKVQNGDFDLDGLCADLQKKAKCSGHGAVVDEKDFKVVMTKYLGKDKEDVACVDSLAAELPKA